MNEMGYSSYNMSQAKYRWYVYELVDPETDTAFYVGKGTKNRIDVHEKETIKGVCSKKCNKIRKIINSGNSIIKRKIAYFLCEQTAYDFETDVIDSYGLANLTNIYKGGQGGFTRRISELRHRKGKQLCPIEIVNRNPDIIMDWVNLTDCGKYKVEEIITGNPLQDAISKMAVLVYNNVIIKVLENAVKKNGGELVIGCA